MTQEKNKNPEMTKEQKELVSKLSELDIQAIDDHILKASHSMWRKVARIVGTAMENQQNRIKGIPDLYYAERVRYLVEAGILEYQGNLNHMGFSEIRLPQD